MLETALRAKGFTSRKIFITRAAVSALLVACAVALPQLIHLIAGQPGGVKWLPMYLPVLIGGCLLGTKWGIVTGVASPLISFLITSLGGAPMPAAERVPFMMAELAVFAAVSGLFSKKIAENGLWAFPAVICAGLSGRLFFLGLSVIFDRFTSFTPEMILNQIMTGGIGLLLQFVLVPVIVMIVRRIMTDE
ncbi:MAG: hypothetical protein IJ251_08260 [Oscillospiraceae bacterium]|nr:hypothetical protein [Oscillospiraceae bacterium]